MITKKLKTSDRTSSHLKNNRSPYVINTAKHDPQLPSVFVFCGQRGSGKSYSAVAMLRHFELKRYITRTFLICPTYKSNPIFQNLETLEDLDCCDEESHFHSAIHHLLAEIEQDWDTYRSEKEYSRVFNKHRKQRDALKFEEEMLLEKEQYRFPEIVHRPSHMVIFDDCQNTSIYSNNMRNNLLQHLTIKHRHIPVSLCFLVQSWSGLPKTLRLNAIVFALFKTGNKRELYWIWENFGAQLEYEKFLQVYNYAVEEPHSFLYIDTAPKREYMRFRKGFNEYIIPSEINEQNKILSEESKINHGNEK